MGEWKPVVSGANDVYCEVLEAKTGYENLRIWSVMGTETFWNPPAGKVLEPEPEPVKGPLKFKSIRK